MAKRKSECSPEEWAAYRQSRREYQVKWKAEHKNYWDEYHRKWSVAFGAQVRVEMIVAYGGQCECCGESEPKFLSLDHSYGNGKEHRKRVANGRQSVGGVRFYAHLRQLGWPKEDGLRLLCFNCHFATDIFGGCPHQEEREAPC